MASKILFVGHCGPDNSYLRIAVRSAAHDATVISADDREQFDRALAQGVDLVLVNRVLDFGFAETNGVELMAGLRRAHPNLKWMLISNHADAQAAARSAGALAGFGKRDIGSAAATAALKNALDKTAELKS
jgi:DNA-binding NarL/FixJ family response regulator